MTGRAEIMDAAHAGGLGGTYGGNPVACAGALGAIETMKELDLNGSAKRIEEVMKGRLAAMQEKYEIIGDIRGRGAMSRDRAGEGPGGQGAEPGGRRRAGEGLPRGGPRSC